MSHRQRYDVVTAHLGHQVHTAQHRSCQVSHLGLQYTQYSTEVVESLAFATKYTQYSTEVVESLALSTKYTQYSPDVVESPALATRFVDSVDNSSHSTGRTLLASPRGLEVGDSVGLPSTHPESLR